MSVLKNFSTFAIETTVELISRNSGDQEEKFTHHQSLVQRILAVSSSCTSIVFCLIAIYMFISIDPRRFVFRHQLIFFLILFDLLKACILLLYPTRVLSHYTAYYNDRFCQIVGFFTATAIEGADIAILSFAVHTCLLIFKPNLSVKVKETGHVEGGLYRYRWYVYAASFFVPIILASLAFISKIGYNPYVCWCYLPQHPVWYRVVLSWVPRYFIVIFIFLVYGLIYFHVIKEFKTLGGVFTTIHKLKVNTGGIYPNSLQEKPSFYSALKFFFGIIRDHMFPKFILPQEGERSEHRSNSTSSKQLKNGLSNQSQDNDSAVKNNGVTSFGGMHIDTQNIIHDPEIQAANLKNFRERQKVIEKQMKSIFIYPAAYCFVWLFPFVLQCTQFNYENKHAPVYWLNCMGAFMQPLNGFVDTLVFLYREKPWQYTIMNNFEKEHEVKMDNIVMNNNNNNMPLLNDNASIATSARYTKKASLSASLGVDLDQYPKWRHRLSQLRLPFLKLPTDANIAKFQAKYLNSKLQEFKGSQLDNIGFGANQIQNRPLTKHDFSNVLSGDLSEKDFRSTLEKFSLNFAQGRRSSMSSLTQVNNNNPSNSINDTSNSSNTTATNEDAYGPSDPMGTSNNTTNKHSKLRHISIADPNEPVIFEGKRYKNTTTESPQSSHDGTQKPHSQLFANTAAANTISLLNTLQQQRKNNANLNAVTDQSSPASPNNNFSNSANTRRYASKRAANRTSNGSSADFENDEEMDFLDFLKKGPPT